MYKHGILTSRGGAAINPRRCYCSVSVRMARKASGIYHVDMPSRVLRACASMEYKKADVIPFPPLFRPQFAGEISGGERCCCKCAEELSNDRNL